MGNAWAGWSSIPVFFSLDDRSPASHPTCEVPFPPRRSGEYRKGMIPARPLYQGGCGSVWDPKPSKERVGDWGGPATVWSLCVLLKRVPQGRTESGGIVLAANAGPRVPSGGVTLKRRCTYRPSVIYLIVNKLLSLSPPPLSLPLSLPPSLSRFCSRSRSLSLQEKSWRLPPSRQMHGVLGMPGPL